MIGKRNLTSEKGGSPMTADIIKDQMTKSRIHVQITEFGDMDGPTKFELSRLQNFLEGRQDIFDVLEQHAANGEKPMPMIAGPKGYESLSTLELLMDDLKGEFSRIAGYCTRKLSLLKKGLGRSHLI